MTISLYGLGLALVLLVGGLIQRAVMMAALGKSAEIDARTLPPERLEEKRRVKKVVGNVLTAEIVILPIIGYLIGHFYLTPR